LPWRKKVEKSHKITLVILGCLIVVLSARIISEAVDERTRNEVSSSTSPTPSNIQISTHTAAKPKTPETMLPTWNGTQIMAAVDTSFMPFGSVNESSGEMEGYDVDVIRAIASKVGLEVKIINPSPENLLDGIARCEYDAAIAHITMTEERKKNMLFTKPYLNAGKIITVLTSNTEISDRDGLQDRLTGFHSQDAIPAGVYLPGSITKGYDSYERAFLELVIGEIDAVSASYPIAQYYMRLYGREITTIDEILRVSNLA